MISGVRIYNSVTHITLEYLPTCVCKFVITRMMSSYLYRSTVNQMSPLNRGRSPDYVFEDLVNNVSLYPYIIN